MITKKILFIFFVFLMIFSCLFTSAPYQAKMNTQSTQSSKTQNSCPILVENRVAIIPIDYNVLYHIYKSSEYNFNLSFNSQTAQDYMAWTSYYNGVIGNISLANNTAIFVIAHNSKTNNIDIITDFCTGPQGSTTFGVKPGDWLAYSFYVNIPNLIPFFGYNNGTPLVQNGDIINVSIIQVLTQPPQVTLNMAIKNSTNVVSFPTNDTGFFVIPLEFIGALINGTFVQNGNNTGPTPSLITYDQTTITIALMSSANPVMNATLILDRMHGTLIKMNGIFLDPQNNSINMTLSMIGSSFTPSLPPQQQSHIYGVNVGDMFVYNFTTNATTKIPFFGLNNNLPVIQNGDTVKITVQNIIQSFNKLGATSTINATQIKIQMSIGSSSFLLNDTMFFIVPLDQIEAVVSGNLPPKGNGPEIELLGSTVDNGTIRMFQTDNASHIIMDFTVTINRHIGNLINMHGYVKDPSGNTIKMELNLAASNVIGTNSTITTSKGNTISTIAPSFTLLTFIPLIALIPVLRKNRKHD